MSSEPTIVAVDDQPEVRELLEEIFGARGQPVRTFAAEEPAREYLRQHAETTSLVLLDLDLGPRARDGLQLLAELRQSYPQLPVVILTGKGTIEQAVAALKAGATDFIEKDPYLEDKLQLSLDKVERMLAVQRERDQLLASNRSLRRHVEQLQHDMGERYAIVGRSAALAAVLEKVVRVARLPRPVLIVGERGTGKELVAHAIHRASPRAAAPFVVMNCGAIAETLLESELFGHERGAFTGATQRKAGRFELADRGTLFLDEIGNMSSEFQIKLLRVLEYQRFARVAGTAEIEVDVRVISATNADLEAAMNDGRFRRDLYDRLAFEVLRLPPLRERREDIPRLAQHFVDRFRLEVGGVRCERIGADAVAALTAYDFPGNVRELKHVVERAAYLARDEALGAEDVLASLPGRWQATVEAPTGQGFEQRVAGYERRLLAEALATTDWRQKDAAAALALTYDQFRHLYRKYDLGRLKPGGAD